MHTLPFLRHLSSTSYLTSKPLTVFSSGEGNNALFLLLVMCPFDEIMYLKMLCNLFLIYSKPENIERFLGKTALILQRTYLYIS